MRRCPVVGLSSLLAPEVRQHQGGRPKAVPPLQVSTLLTPSVGLLGAPVPAQGSGASRRCRELGGLQGFPLTRRQQPSLTHLPWEQVKACRCPSP